MGEPCEPPFPQSPTVENKIRPPAGSSSTWAWARVWGPLPTPLREVSEEGLVSLLRDLGAPRRG